MPHTIRSFAFKWLQHRDNVYGDHSYDSENDFNVVSDWWLDIPNTEELWNKLDLARRQYTEGPLFIRRHGGIGAGGAGGLISSIVKIGETVTRSEPKVLPYQEEVWLRLQFADGEQRHLIASIFDLLFLFDPAGEIRRKDACRPIVTTSIRGFRQLAQHLGSLSQPDFCQRAFARDAGQSGPLPKSLREFEDHPELWVDSADLVALASMAGSNAAKNSLLKAAVLASFAASIDINAVKTDIGADVWDSCALYLRHFFGLHEAIHESIVLAREPEDEDFVRDATKIENQVKICVLPSDIDELSELVEAAEAVRGLSSPPLAGAGCVVYKAFQLARTLSRIEMAG